MIFMVSALFSKTPQSEAFVNILFFLTFIGALLNTFIFDPSKDKYYAVVLLRIDAREFAIVNYAYELCKILIGFFSIWLNIRVVKQCSGVCNAHSTLVCGLCQAHSICLYFMVI